jgi:hypothetical protein
MSSGSPMSSPGWSFACAMFASGLNQLEGAYRAGAHHLELAKLSAELMVRQGLKVAVDEQLSEAFGSGRDFTACDFEEEVFLARYEAEARAVDLRRATLVSLFRFWERNSNRWIDNRGGIYRHARVMDWLHARGGNPDELATKKLWLAANCVMHDGSELAYDQLSSLDESFFKTSELDLMNARRPTQSKAAQALHDWVVNYRQSHRQFQITATMLDKMFAAVRKSGPL